MLLRPIAAILFAGFTLATAAPAQAQRGQSIENLFRSIVEAELENIAGRQRDPSRSVGPGAQGPPSGQREPQPRLGPDFQPRDPRSDFGTRPAGTARSRPNDPQLLTLRDHLRQFHAHARTLTQQVRQQSSQVAGSRQWIGGLLHLEAQADALARQAAAEENIRTLVEPFREVNRQWRVLSYQLPLLPGLSPTSQQSIAALDQLSQEICRTLGIAPVLDRQRIQILMIVTTTYLNALLDDLQLVHGNPRTLEALMHDGHILQQQLERQAQRVATADLNQIMPSFHDFVMQWRRYATRLYALEDSHLDRRLQRIRQGSEEIYALLSLPPSPDLAYLRHVSARLEHHTGELLGQLSVRALVSLPTDQQEAILRDARQLHGLSRQNHPQLAWDEERFEIDRLRNHFGGLDRRWRSLESRLAPLDTIDQAVLTKISLCSDELRDAVGLRDSLDRRQLLKLAATLEGQSEYLAADVERFRSYYAPRSFGDQIRGSAARFLQLSQRLHDQAIHGDELAVLQVTCQSLLSEWSALSEHIRRLPNHGLTGGRSAGMAAALRELEPTVAELAAMLID